MLVLNGPNLNMLGLRQPEVYGKTTHAELAARLVEIGAELGLTVTVRQSNHEGEALDWIHAARGTVDAIVINPGGWTHTSVALADALVIPEVPVIEVHISNVHAREEFRHHSYVTPIATGVIAGLGVEGYEYALRKVAALLA